MNNTITQENRFGRDSGLHLSAYWIKNRFEIANMRGWECDADCAEKPQCFYNCTNNRLRRHNCGTFKSYAHYLTEVLGQYIKKPICAITIDDVRFAINKLRTEENYSESTLISIVSTLSVVFRYAHFNGDAYNLFKYTRQKKHKTSLIETVCSAKNERIIKQLLEDEREALAKKPRSLTTAQIEMLAEYVWNNIETDGRLCLIVLMLYAGVRPAEGRALFWKDINSFIDHPDREVINLYKTRNGKGEIVDRMKTDNAFRRIPVHFELGAFLKKRRDHVKNNVPDGKIDDLPICCFRNEYNQPCKDYEAAMIAEDIFNTILKLDRETMYAYSVEHISERVADKSKDKEGEELQHLSLYVLRKNFWTWLQALTTLSDIEKRVIMGHDLGDEKRENYNNEGLLWNICRKMDSAVLCKHLHEPSLYIDVCKNKNCPILDKGIFRIRITKEMVEAGGELVINVSTEEIADEVVLNIRNLPSDHPPINLTAEAFGIAPLEHKVGINCEYENWLAHERVTQRSRFVRAISEMKNPPKQDSGKAADYPSDSLDED